MKNITTLNTYKKYKIFNSLVIICTKNFECNFLKITANFAFKPIMKLNLRSYFLIFKNNNKTYKGIKC
jgi:hypothetical protein